MVVRLRPAFGIKLHRPIRHTRARLLLAGILEKPLLRKSGLNRHIRPLTKPDVVRVILRLHQRANSLQLFRRYLTRLKSIEPSQVRSCQLVHFAVGGNHIDHLQIMPLSNVKIRLVVCRRHLEHTCAKFYVDVFIRHYRQF